MFLCLFNVDNDLWLLLRLLRQLKSRLWVVDLNALAKANFLPNRQLRKMRH